MKPEWMKFLPVWAPEGEGDGGGSSASDGAGEGGDGGAGQGGDAGAQSSASKPGADSGGGKGLYDFVEKGGTKDGDDKSGGGSGGDWTVPEHIPEHLRGDTAETTLDKVFKAYNGARKGISEGKQGAAEDVPETSEGYEIAPAGDDDKVAAELNAEASKPLVDSYRKAAHELGIGKAQFESFMRKGLEHAQEAGIPIGLPNEEAAKLSGEAELEGLVTEVGRREATTMMNTIHTFGDKLVADGVWNENDMGEWLEAAGTSGATKAIYKMMTARLGEKPIPMDFDGADGAVTPMAAQALYAKAQKMPEGAEKNEALEHAQAAMQKAYGTEPRGGSMRSSVL